MMSKRGFFIVIEGTDGSGKTVQFRKLTARLRKENYKVKTFDFPQYGRPSSYFVRQYLTGRYGGWREVGPYKASVFYALDRFAAADEIRARLTEGKVIISNRYTASNMGHQGAKIGVRSERAKFFRWLDGFEHGLLGMPEPDLNIILHVPARVAQKLVDRKGARKYLGGAKRDLHEADLKHLKQAKTAYLELAKTFPRKFKLVECVEKGKLLTPEEIHERVWKIVRKTLKTRQ